MTDLDYSTAWAEPDPGVDSTAFGEHPEHGADHTALMALAPRFSGIAGDPLACVTSAIPSPNYGSRHGLPVRLIIFHTAEGALTTGALGNYFSRASAQVSSHVGIDDSGVCRMVPEAYSAWAALNANPVGTQAEICGFAGWSEADWRAHPGILENAAQWVAQESVLHGIPAVQLTPAQSVSGTGVCMHWDITRGWGVGTHVDAGTAFEDVILPQVILPRARQILAGGNAPVTPDTPPAPVAPPTVLAPTALPVLREGVTPSGWVTLLQRALTALGRYTGLPDGIFGPATTAAVKAAQAAQGWGAGDVDGVAGPHTWAYAVLHASGTLSAGASGVAVEVLQNYLDLRPGAGLDGQFGPTTTALVQAVQRWGGLTGTDVDGVVGLRTCDVLARA